MIRISAACAQATSCRPAPIGYVCSTYNADYNNKTCNTGCDDEEQE